MAQEKRYRVRRLFQLDLNNPEHEEIDEIITQLKKDRVYSPAIRDGLRLIAELREGKTDFLEDQFPWIAAALGGSRVNLAQLDIEEDGKPAPQLEETTTQEREQTNNSLLGAIANF